MIDDDVQLGTSARALLREAGAADGPPPGTKDRVRVALTAAIAAGAVTAATTASATGASATGSLASGSAASAAGASTGAASAVTTASATGATVAGLLGTSLFTKVAAVAVTLGAVGTIAVASGALESAPAPPSRPAVVAATEPALLVPPVALPATGAPATGAVERAVEAPVAEPLPLEASPVVDEVVVRRPHAVDPEPTEVAPVVTPEPVPSTLAIERPILGAGRLALRDGDPATALARVDEHERRFPAGELAEERDALRVRALCALGRADEAGRARDAFLARYPTSMSAAAVRALCGAP